MRNSTNVLIANMAVADILITLIFPYVLKWLYVGSTWFGTFMGAILCKFFHSAQALSIACSVITLVFISLDRCLVFWFPLRQLFSNRVLKASLAASWVYAVAVATPLMVVTTSHPQTDGSYHCTELNWSSVDAKVSYHTAFTICTYVIPLVVITVAYLLIAVKLWNRELPGHQTLESQKKAHQTTKKAITMLVTVVVVFALCWLPFQAREIMISYFPDFISYIPFKVDIFLPWIGFTNSAINPCLYVIFSENYRREFRRILCCEKSSRDDMYLGIPASRATPVTTPLFPRRGLSAATETLPLRHLTLKENRDLTGAVCP